MIRFYGRPGHLTPVSMSALNRLPSGRGSLGECFPDRVNEPRPAKQDLLVKRTEALRQTSSAFITGRMSLILRRERP